MSSALRIGAYLVGAKVGQGGMANIHLAWDERASAGPIALKVLREEFRQAPLYVEMFLDEARIAAQLAHPNVVAVQDFGVDAAGPFIAMELLAGRCVADVFDVLAARSERVPWQVACWICARVAEGLHHAHELRSSDGASLELVHRDVNPSNVFVTRDGGVKLLDFGLARAVGRDAGSAPGKVKGKLAYLAPEQLGAKVVDRRTDIFQLGITLWELCTGQRLFKRDSQNETLREAQACKVPPPREIDPALPAACERVILRALARAPEQRFTTARGFARALDDVLAPVPTAESLERFLESIFPGERAREQAWLGSLVRPSSALSTATMVPPAPLPGDLGNARTPR